MRPQQGNPAPEVKEPWRAVFLNSFLPGLGEIYSGFTIRGLAFILSTVLLLYLFIIRAFSLIYVPEAPAGIRDLAILAIILMLFLILYLSSFVDAYLGAKSQNRALNFQLPLERKKSPWLSATLSRFIPGLGQLYNGFRASAFVHLACWLALMWLFYRSWLIALAGLVMAWSMIDAYDSATRINGKDGRIRHDMKPLAISIMILCLVLLHLPSPILARNFLFRTFRIGGGAMEPTLRMNDRVVVDTILFRFTGIKRGDIVTFECPDRPSGHYTKRIVGMPGEAIEIREGRILINGEPLVTGGIIDRISYLHYGNYCRPGEVVHIPQNCYFFLGDRIENSLDSRHFGPIPREKLGGRVVKIFRPRSRAGPVR